MSSEKKEGQKQKHQGIRIKDGAFLSPKVERIMMQIARERSVEWIADLFDVQKSYVVYIGKKTGFPSSTFPAAKKTAERKQHVDAT